MDGDLRDALKRAVGDYSGGKSRRKTGGQVSGRLGGCGDCRVCHCQDEMQGSGAVGGAKRRKPRKTQSGSVVSGGPLSGSVVSGAKKRVTKKDQQELVALVNALLRDKPKKRRGGYCDDDEEDDYESD